MSSIVPEPAGSAKSDCSVANENKESASGGHFGKPSNDLSPDRQPKSRFVGRGRGAEVYAVEQPDGTTLARKVFVGSGLARVVHQIFFGADNPYVWDRTALEEAMHRRRVLGPLVSWWLKGKARVAAVHETSWNAEHHVNEWSMEFIDGRPALLRQPLSDAPDEMTDLLDNVMRPLQAHLVEAGFDGAAWQAGLYNPVATSNFLRRANEDGSEEWVWIDAESGVPALFPANPLGLFKYYIPRSFKFRHPLFDDVDVQKLREYIASHEADLRRDIGDEGCAELSRNIEALDIASSSTLWKRLSRVGRGIQARLTRKEIDDRQARFYRRHPVLWVIRETGFGLSLATKSIATRLKAWFHPRLWTMILVQSLKLMISDRYRMAFARTYVGRNIDAWHKRKQLDQFQSEKLRAELNDAATAVYLTDFGMHLAVKPIVKLITWGIFPILLSFGVLDPVVVAFFVVGGGAISRSLYTGYRISVATVRNQPKPWVAFMIGVLPAIGNLAFPVQVLFDGVRGGRGVSQFIVYDTVTKLGQFVPIWGGADTLTEHRANRLAHWAFSFDKRQRA
jgi:hypothetical protein